MSFKRSEGLVTQAIGQEMLVFNPSSGKAHCLGESAAQLFLCLEQEQSIERLRGLRMMNDEALQIALAELNEQGLIRQSAGSGSRREFLKIASIVSVAPLLSTVSIPTPAAAASVAAITACTSTDMCASAGAGGVCAVGERRCNSGGACKVCTPGAQGGICSTLCGGGQGVWYICVPAGGPCGGAFFGDLGVC